MSFFIDFFAGNQITRPIVCIVLSLTCLGLVGLGRIYHPQVGKSGTMQSLLISPEENDCPVKITSSIWTLCFRWLLGLLLPAASIFTLATFIKIKCWPRCSIALRSHIDFCISMTMVNLLLQAPSLALEITHFLNVSPPTISFSLHVLSTILPKLNLSLYPLGILTILPWRQQSRTKSPKNEMEMMTEEDLKLLPINLEKSPSTNV